MTYSYHGGVHTAEPVNRTAPRSQTWWGEDSYKQEGHIYLRLWLCVVLLWPVITVSRPLLNVPPATLTVP
jgi:hypothetical protein